MRYIIMILFVASSLDARKHPINISGLLSSSKLNQDITANQQKERNIALSGEFSQADLSKIIENKVSAKKIIYLSGLISANQLNSVIQFIYTKQQQAKRISGLISQKDLDRSLVWKTKKKKPNVHLSGLIVQNYLDPDYQAAMKILNDPILQKEYDADLAKMKTYFKEYYLTDQNFIQKNKIPFEVPKVCCPTQDQNYTLCQTEQ